MGTGKILRELASQVIVVYSEFFQHRIAAEYVANSACEVVACKVKNLQQISFFVSHDFLKSYSRFFEAGFL